ncbi:acyl-CoA hydrolase [Pseudoxanthomonas broegbernensis]|nr:acyl-CoA hydrolase [Pseudoxanthomonas broegbernensis]
MAAGGRDDLENTAMSEAPQNEARATEARLLHMVFPDHTNHLGTLFGGQALAWMDMASFIAASRYARSTVVTARSEQVDFNQPIHKGDLVEVIARLVKVGRSSMNVDVEVITEDLLSGERKLCTRGHFVMIALDPLGQPTPVPPLPAPASAREPARSP